MTDLQSQIREKIAQVAVLEQEQVRNALQLTEVTHHINEFRSREQMRMFDLAGNNNAQESLRQEREQVQRKLDSIRQEQEHPILRSPTGDINVIEKLTELTSELEIVITLLAREGLNPSDVQSLTEERSALEYMLRALQQHLANIEQKVTSRSQRLIAIDSELRQVQERIAVLEQQREEIQQVLTRDQAEKTRIETEKTTRAQQIVTLQAEQRQLEARQVAVSMEAQTQQALQTQQFLQQQAQRRLSAVLANSDITQATSVEDGMQRIYAIRTAYAGLPIPNADGLRLFNSNPTVQAVENLNVAINTAKGSIRIYLSYEQQSPPNAAAKTYLPVIETNLSAVGIALANLNLPQCIARVQLHSYFPETSAFLATPGLKPLHIIFFKVSRSAALRRVT